MVFVMKTDYLNTSKSAWHVLIQEGEFKRTGKLSQTTAQNYSEYNTHQVIVNITPLIYLIS